MEETQEDSCNSSSSCPNSPVSHGSGIQPKPHSRLHVYVSQWSPMAHHNGYSNANNGSSHHFFFTTLAPTPPIRTDWTRGSSTVVLAPGLHAQVTSQHVHPTTSKPASPANLSTAIYRHQGNAHFVFAISTRYPVQYSQWRGVVAWVEYSLVTTKSPRT